MFDYLSGRHKRFIILYMTILAVLFFSENAEASEESSFTIAPASATENLPSQDMSDPMMTFVFIRGVDKVDKNKLKVESEPIQIGETHKTVDPFLSAPTYWLDDDIIYLKAEYPGEYDIKITYGDTTRPFKWKIDGIRCNPSGILLAKSQKAKITVTHSNPRNFYWISDNEEIAIVAEDGTVIAQNEGNVVIRGVHKEEEYQVGCVVSVTSPEKESVIQRAKQISRGTYSQARRMSQGYYDCSSLVWLAYRIMGFDFGVHSGNAPVAANEAAYMASHGKIYSYWSWDGLQAMKYQAGDIMFRTNSGSKRYGGIDHVEMVSGYELERFDKSGKPEVLCTWINRPPGYCRMLLAHDLMGRP